VTLHAFVEFLSVVTLIVAGAVLMQTGELDWLRFPHIGSLRVRVQLFLAGGKFNIFLCRWIPPEIGSLGNLEELDLSFNKLKALPQEFALLKSLKSLRVASNKLVELPSQLAALVNLINIDVAHNRLTSLQSLGLLSMTSLRSLNAQVSSRHPELTCRNSSSTQFYRFLQVFCC
jgi:hypothetical protein